MNLPSLGKTEFKQPEAYLTQLGKCQRTSKHPSSKYPRKNLLDRSFPTKNKYSDGQLVSKVPVLIYRPDVNNDYKAQV